MGNFANTGFRTLLGWLKGLAFMIWSEMTPGSGNSFLHFIGKNWIIIAAVFCAVGILVDFAVYLFRWEPYKVWMTFFRNLRGKKAGTASENVEAAAEPEGIFFSTSREKTAADNVETMPEEEPDDLLRWREPEPEEETDPGIRNVVTRAGYVVPEDSPYRRPDTRQRRRRIRISNLLGDSDDEEEYHYNAPPPIMDKNEAYNPPVYPEKWTENREQDS